MFLRMGEWISNIQCLGHNRRSTITLLFGLVLLARPVTGIEEWWTFKGEW